MPDIFDQIPEQPQGDIFDQVAMQQPAPQPVQQFQQQQEPDVFDQIQPTQADFQSTVQPVPVSSQMGAAPVQTLQPGQPLQGNAVENWFNGLPVVQDFRKAQSAGDWGGGVGSTIVGLPAGPMEMVDMGSSALRWLQDQAAQQVIGGMTQGLNPMVQDMLENAAMTDMEQSVARVPQSNFAEDYKQFIRPKYPGLFGGGAFIGQSLVPVGTVGRGATLAHKLAIGALGGGGMSGLYDIGTQYRDTGHVNPMQTAASVLLGTGIGGLGAGAVHGIEKAAGALASRFIPKVPPQQGRFSPGQVGQGLDEQAQHELAALMQGQQQQGGGAVQQMRDLAQEADMANFFGARPEAPPAALPAMPRANSPEEALSMMERMTGKQASAGKQEPDIMDVAKARHELTNRLRGAANQDELDSTAEAATRWVQKNFTNGEVRKAMHQEISRQRKTRLAEFDGEKPKLDQTVDDLQKASTPAESETALKEWAKDALKEELDPASLGAQLSEDVPQFYDVESVIALSDYEARMYPRVFKEYLFDGARKLKTNTSDANGFIPANLEDSQLASLKDWYEVEAKRPTMTKPQKAKVNEINRALSDETMRREQRKVMGVPLQPTGMKSIYDLSEDELVRVANNGTEKQQMQAINEVARREALAEKHAPASKPEREMGNFRRTIPDSMKGRNKNRLAVDIHENPVFNKRPIKLMLRKYGDAKILADYHEARLKNYIRGFAEKYVPAGRDTFELPNGVKIKLKTEEKPSIQTEMALHAAREKFEQGVDATQRPVIAGMLSKYFGDGPDKIPFQKVALPDTFEAASATLSKLYGAAKKADNDYKALRPNHWAKKVDDIQKKIDEKQSLIQFGENEKVKARAREAAAKYHSELSDAEEKLEEAMEDQKLLQSLEKEFAAHVGDETAPVNIKTMIPHPEEGMPAAEFALEYRKGTQQKYILPEDVPKWEEAKAQILRADSNRPRRQFWEVDGNSARKLVPAITGGAAVAQFFTGQAAHAADLGTKAVSQGIDIGAAWAHSPANEMIGAAAMLHLAAPKVAKAVLNEETWAGANLWKNTLDHVEYLEKIGVIPGGLKNKILNHTAQTLKASWGVSFDEDSKALGMHFLREGAITPAEVIAGKSARPHNLQTTGHQEALQLFAGMDQAQKNALCVYKITQDSLRRTLADQIRITQNFLDANQAGPKQLGAINESLNALRYMQEQVSPRGEIFTTLDRIAARLRANFMDYAFFWNPAFHGTNLSDSFIAGGSMTGPVNILRAWKLMASDKEMRSLYKDSNLVGGFKAERVQDGVVLKESDKFSLFPKADLNSDLFNANRVSLSSLLQYHQRNKADLLKAGFSGSDVDFAKAILKGDQSIPADVAADAWVHMAGTLSEALGVDTFRLNTDILSRSKMASSMAVFFKQPARVSRLAMNYMAKGDFKSFYTLVGYSAVLGGASAAIPLEGEIAGQLANPESYFKAADFADKLDLYEKATGKKLGPKLKWGIIWALQAGNSPVLEQPQEALGTLFAAAAKNDQKLFIKAAERAVPMAAPKVAGIPTRMIISGMKALEESKAQQFKSFPQIDPITKRPDFKKTITIPFDKIERSPVVHFFRQYVPGVEPARYEHQQVYNEQRVRKARGQMVPPAEQYYSPADIYRTPMEKFFGKDNPKN